MDFNAYWASPLVYTFLLIIFFINDSVSRSLNTAVERAFRLMTLWVIFFCMQDVVWGFCDSGFIRSERFFFASSAIFHLSTVITTFFWLYFVLAYLHVSPKRRRIYLIADNVLLLVQFVVVGANFFTPTIFSIVDGQYVTAFLRPLAFFNQYVVYLGTVIVSLLYMTGVLRRRTSDYQQNYLPVFAASLAPTLLGILQLLFPYASFYSLGYFLACYIIHIFVIAKDRENADKAMIFQSISKTYYSMHLIDMETSKVSRYIESPILTRLINDATDAQEMLNRVITGTANDDYRALLLDFVNLSTLSERMAGKSMISCEFIGRNYGWTRISFVSIESIENQQKQVMVYTQIIDNSKRQEIDLIFKSNNDELTSLFNRYAYENEINKLPENSEDDSLVLIAMDINGLKQVNDTYGHAAGDELIIGAADCMKRCFIPYGKIFRTGGDEFFAIIHTSQTQLTTLLRDFEESTIAWHGKTVDSLAISYGYVTRQDVKNGNIREMITLADERMYKSKTEYYRKKGVDRRGQRDAHIALCALYTKILKINLTDDSFQIINMEINEKTANKGYSEHISEWLHDFGKSGMVHPDDLEEYLQKTTISYMKDYFAEDKTSLHILYRRKIDTSFKQVMMEIIPANDYAPDNQSFYLYVKNIDN